MADRMTGKLTGKRIAVLATNGVEQIELTTPWEAAELEGAALDLISTKPGRIQGRNHDDKADTFPVDRTTDQARVQDYDALLIPGGVASPDRLRLDQAAVRFVRDFVDSGKPVASICHGPWLLVEADVVRGRTISSWPSLQTDIRNAGGQWADVPVHVEQGIVTSRKPADLPAFCQKLVEEIAEGTHAARAMGPGQQVRTGTGVGL